ncbi:signal recognition particle-docking protein FtsY [Pseudanabaena sp. FACHB-1277]|uniref:Signal recognition particle receptor FtsY n=1 Tax=Pseudanabaena cinerea FACHB-1277 TaxID=2949581 RepID=A0A926UU86_9CYAN|nr:signal recognition particle-docking protein FtsY [Pseudanabaena cinerea]MBD2151344.1 signal recognition particle-docking protein FtsY [Pseudanabaena cinerea FACHB-1277]
MVFNWFRRKFDDDKDAQNQPNQAVEPVVTEEQAPEPEATATPPASQDLLNWAKAAYANVQQQAEVAEVAEPEVADAVTTEAELVTSEAATETQATETAVSEPETNDSVVTEITQSITEPVDRSPLVEAIAPEVEQKTELVTEPIIEPIIEPTAPNADAPVPFWMQSESDRLARIAALEATAIAAPEPEVKPAPRRKATIKFDDDFIWSAEVLASQGRRPEEISAEEITWLNRLRQGLDKTRLSLVNQLKSIVGQGPLNPEAVDDIEALLLQADVGVKATDQIIAKLQDKLRSEVLPPEEAIAYLKQILREMLDVATQKGGEPIPMLIPEKNQLNIWLITGVNGAGKTTTIGKLSHLSVKSGYKTLIAAADTFRAAAVEQVKSWGLRSNVEVIANPAQNADPAAVVFDAIAAAQARGTELLLVDTAGRLQNKKNLMEELSKIRRIVDKKSADAKIESLLVLDSTLGQNGLKQAEVFAQSANITGVILTKLDGTAKGGVAIAVVQQLGLPIRFIGAGEGIEDLRPFSSYEFVEALLSN